MPLLMFLHQIWYFSGKFLMCDVLATSLILTGHLFAFHHHSSPFRMKRFRFIIFEFLWSISNPHVCLFVPNWKTSLRWAGNNILRYAWPAYPFTDNTSLCFGFNEVQCCWCQATFLTSAKFLTFYCLSVTLLLRIKKKVWQLLFSYLLCKLKHFG